MIRKKKEYSYLLSYGFSRKVGDKLQYTEGGTGRTFLNLSKEIKTQNDIIEVENILRETVEIDNLCQFSLYAFSLLNWLNRRSKGVIRRKMKLNYNNIDIKSDLVRNEFYIDLANKLEDMYNKSTTFGEVTLVGDLILLLNKKLKEDVGGQSN